MRDPLWPTTQGEVFRLVRLSTIPTLEDPEPDESLLGVGPTDQVALQNSDGDAFPIFTAFGHLDGARLAFNTVAKIDVGTIGTRTSFLDSTGFFFIWFDGVLTGDMAVSGAGGLRAALTEAADTFYFVHLIADTTGVNATKVFFDTSATAPVLPAGYDVFRRVGQARNNAALDFLKFSQHGNGRDRWIYYDEDNTVTQVLSGGSDTGYTPVDLSDFVPTISNRVHLFLFFDPQNAASQLFMRPDGSSADPPLYKMRSGATGADESFQIMPTSSAQLIEYHVSVFQDDADIHVAGYVDEL